MKAIIVLLRTALMLVAVVGCSRPGPGTGHLKLWYDEPADAGAPDDPNGWNDDPHWLRALPLGNGSLGAMVFGDVNRERIQLNEESMWSGSAADHDNPAAYAALQPIRQMLFEGRFREATELTNSTQVCQGAGSGHGNGATVPFGCFQTLGDLWIDFDQKGEYTDYYRELDLNDAVARVQYTQQGVRFKREAFISHPDQVMVIRFTANKPGQHSFTCSMTRPERYKVTVEENQLILWGSLNNGKGGEGLQYMARLTALNRGGRVSYHDAVITVEGADEVVLLLSASTDHVLRYPDYTGRDYQGITTGNIRKAVAQSYGKLFRKHQSDYQKYFNRVFMTINPGAPDTLPTDERVTRFRSDPSDPHLITLAFQYGRYLLLSSSRPGTLPANLQGLWANKIQTPWNGDYHTDVNVEMNYWPAEVTNLSELHLPLFDLIAALVEPGRKTAAVHYRANGWVIHPITNVWGYTSPGESASWGMHTGAGAWMCQHIAEHYRFTGDRTFLEKMYPVLKSSVAFYLDWLTKDPGTGKLVSGPAVSPENTFLAPDGSPCQISMGPAHDQQVIWQLFADFLYGSEELGISDEFVTRVAKAQEQLAGPAIGSDGRLMEWAREYPEVEPGHRHISHLFAVHPGSQITMLQTPALALAAKKSLDYRIAHGGGHTGWSAAWLISQYARLHDAEKARASLDTVLARSTSPNLFGQHPPFQMDANFGTTAGIAEMLLQSHAGCIDVLPALPADWKEGFVKGLKARGNCEVDIYWSAGKLQKLTVRAFSDQSCRLRYGNQVLDIQAERGKTYVFGPGLGRID